MTYPVNLRPLGYQQITSLAASTALTVPVGTAVVKFRPAAQAIRFRDDGVAPTASVGFPVAVGETFTYEGSFAQLRLIEQAASATVDVLYYGA